MKPENINESRLIQASVVRDLCGGVSDMSLWRWLHNPTMNFPQPRYIAQRRYWRETDVLDWLNTRPKEAA